MNTSMVVTADELVSRYKDGERRGFIAGVIFSAVGYALIRRMNAEDRRRVSVKQDQKIQDEG